MQKDPAAQQSFLTPSTLVRVISLKTDTERRAAFRAHATGTRLPWDFFDGLTTLSAELQYSPDDAFVTRGRALSPQELGCYSSHYTLWQEFLASPHQQLLVLEDDTFVDWVFIENILRYDLAARGMQYLRLFSKAAGRPVLLGPFLDRYLVENVSYALGMQAYILTRDGAAFLVSHLRQVRCPIDDAIDRGWRGSLPNIGVFPSPVIELSGKSRIGDERHAPTAIPPRLRWRRFAFRAWDRVLRTLYPLHRRIARSFEPPDWR